MADKIKQTDHFIFDQDYKPAIQKEERPGFATRVKSFFRSRYALLAIIFCLCGAIIFYNTAALQLNPATAAGISQTVGVPRQQTIRAPRGDIVDSAGIPLAYTRSANKVFITYAGLESDDLNRRLLDLALFLEAHGVRWQTNLKSFIDLDHSGCDHEEETGAECGVPAWQLPIEDIIHWQQDRNLFNLTWAALDGPAAFDDRYVKTDPAEFYDYLLYERFRIENPQAETKIYSQADAFRIMQLRFLIYENNWIFRGGTPLEVARDVSDEVVHIINEQNFRFLGVITGRDSERVYSEDAVELSHILGYVGSISANQYFDMRNQGYAQDAIIGQAGVEASAERYLAGQDGIKPYNIWTVAGEEGAFYPETIGKDPQPGNTVRLTIDLELQKIARASLEAVIEEIRNSPDNKNRGDADAGAVVMLDVKTGAVLAMASYPGYDPNDFIVQSWDEAAADRVRTYLTDNVDKPMLNRAMMEIYAPGSTFKPATVVAGLESGAITPTNNIIRCVGSEIIGDWPWRCLERPRSGHGDLTLTRALATSCNMYFYHLGVRTGINQIDYWGRQLGLGEITGVDLPWEVKGFRASRETKALLRNNPEDQIWFPADTCQTAIGQFDNAFTILQLAVYAASLATGERVTPHVIDQIISPDGVIMVDRNIEPVPIGLQQSTLDAVRQGMVASITSREGTAHRAFADFPIAVAAKTGTAETGFEDVSSSNGLFICYAPADDPQVAIAQIVEKGAWGSNTIAIAIDLLSAYFNLEGYAVPEPIPAPGWTDLQTGETGSDDAGSN